MNTPSKFRRPLLWVLGLMGACTCVTILGIASLFFLSGDAEDMRDAVLSSSGDASLKTKIQLNVGPLSTGLIRCVVSQIDKVDKDARLALACVRSASVGVYEGGKSLRSDASSLERIESYMTKQGWSRVVSVQERKQRVLIYARNPSSTSSTLRLSLAVLDGDTLVIAGLRGSGEPLQELLSNHLGQLPGKFTVVSRN